MSRISDKPARTASSTYLWIACCEGPPAMPELESISSKVFVHHNLGNLVNETDLNCISTVQSVIELGGVTDAIICGHYGCAAVQAALSEDSLGRIDNWLSPITQLYQEQRLELHRVLSMSTLRNRLCELNVYQQLCNLCSTGVVQDAWARGQPFAAQGWIYDEEGYFQDLGISVSNAKELIVAQAHIGAADGVIEETAIAKGLNELRGKHIH